MSDIPENIYLFEEHSATLPVWWSRRGRPRNVVYLDAHLDLQKTSESSVEALRACKSIEEVKALEAPHHLDSSPQYAFDIENFLYPASRLDLIERLIWVAPPHIPRHYSAALIEYMQQTDGISFDELTGFESIGDNSMRGSLMGLDITICDYDQLESLDIGDDYYLDIDIDYFVQVPEDRLWIDPAKVVARIIEQLGEPSLVTISRAVSSGFTPLAFRFVGDYLYSRFCRQTERFEYYWRLNGAIQSLNQGRIEAGRQACESLTGNNPEYAAGWYLLALISKDAAEKNRLLEQAARLDDNYRFDLERDSIGLLHRKKKLDPTQLRRLLQALEKQQLSQPERSRAEIALAKILAAAGDIAAAERLLRRQHGKYADHEDVLLAIVANQLQDKNLYPQNRDRLKRVCADYKNVTVANQYLGDLEFAEGNHEAALEHYLAAHRRAEAWMLPLKGMLATHQQMLNQAQYDQVKEQIKQREKRLRQLLD